MNRTFGARAGALLVGAGLGAGLVFLGVDGGWLTGAALVALIVLHLWPEPGTEGRPPCTRASSETP